MSSVACHPLAVARPVVAVIAVVVRDRRVLLVRRANPPDAGRWGFPGGKVEFGETVAQAAVRELAEETAIVGEAGEVSTVLDAIDLDENGSVRSHHVLVAVTCAWISGAPAAGDDALDARWFDPEELTTTDVDTSRDVSEVARRAVSSYVPVGGL